MINKFYGIFKDILLRAKKLEEDLTVVDIEPNMFNSIRGYNKYRTYLGIADSLRDSYNVHIEDLKSLPNDIYKALGIIPRPRNPYGMLGLEIQALTGTISDIISGSTGIVSVLESHSSNIPQKDAEEISLLKQLNEKIKDYNPLIYNHVEEALDQLGKGFNIGPVLIAGKVVSYLFDQIELDSVGRKRVDEMRKEVTDCSIQKKLAAAIDEEKTRILKDKGIIEKGEADNLIKSLKDLRNYYSHDLQFVPKNSADVLTMLSQVVSLASKFAVAYDRKGEEQ